MTPVLDSWQSSGQPGIERYGLTVTPDGGHVLWLDHAEQVVTTLH
ncbi:protein-L-isoaspartate methyltransferase [Saccharomonospora phage PIS 136]|nr:protein-L-isoaspartate methyltransferase [Saccharomonospora phage PIS 136]